MYSSVVECSISKSRPDGNEASPRPRSHWEAWRQFSERHRGWSSVDVPLTLNWSGLTTARVAFQISDPGQHRSVRPESEILIGPPGRMEHKPEFGTELQ